MLAGFICRYITNSEGAEGVPQIIIGTLLRAHAFRKQRLMLLAFGWQDLQRHLTSASGLTKIYLNSGALLEAVRIN